jgi:predicted HTH domain antitoxin
MPTTPVTLQDAIEMTLELSPVEQLRLVATLADRLSCELRLVPIQLESKVSAEGTPGHAMALYRQGTVTLARAAEMVGVTRWDLAHLLQTLGTPVTVEVPPAAEMDRDLAAYLE